MINIYDGTSARVGRVVTDSTWHHWFDLNLVELEDRNPVAWEKISRYYLNIAMWLSPAISRRNCHMDIIVAPYVYPGVEVLDINFDTERLGIALSEHLRFWKGPCWVTEFIQRDICDLAPEFCKTVLPLDQLPEPIPSNSCWSCPPWERFEYYALGGLARAAFEFQNEIQHTLKHNTAKCHFTFEEVEKRLTGGLSKSIKEFASQFVSEAKEVMEHWSSLANHKQQRAD